MELHLSPSIIFCYCRIVCSAPQGVAFGQGLGEVLLARFVLVAARALPQRRAPALVRRARERLAPYCAWLHAR